MNSILYTSGNNFYVKTETDTVEYASEKIVSYCNTLKSIARRNEWKTSGAGAKFMNSYSPGFDENDAKRDTSINGVSAIGGEVIYSASFGEVSGIFRKALQKNLAEGLVRSSRDMRIYRLCAHGDKCAASIGDRLERHIAIFDIESGSYNELTEGEVQEDYPSYSKDGGRIFYSSAGLALSGEGIPLSVGPFGICSYNVETNGLDELLVSDKFDYIAPKEDAKNNLLFIKRPYRNAESGGGNILLDLLLFPVRIIKAIGGLLNYFSIIFGGESLRTGKTAKDVKAKPMSEKDLFIDGNVINAQQMLKENQRRGEKNPGIIPHSWELIRMDEDGDQKCIKKGVLDFTICANGDIVYSNGAAIIRLLSDGGEQLLEKCRMACNLIELQE